MKKQDKQDIREQAEIEEDINDRSESGIDRDIETLKASYPSEDIANDIYAYKVMRLKPESQMEFMGLIDKDVVLANISEDKPDKTYTKLLVESFIAVESVFVTRKLFYVNKNNQIIGEVTDINKKTDFKIIAQDIFDEEFRPILNLLKGNFKYEMVSSRAMGKQRESILDRTQNVTKEVRKPIKEDNKYA